MPDGARRHRRSTVVVGGITAAYVDQTDSISARLPLFIGAVILLSFLLLLAVFRSVLVPLKAAVMNLLSIGAAYGVRRLCCRGRLARAARRHHDTDADPGFIPMMMFAILFGLSMDYEVFLLSRIREEYLRTGDNATAVADGLAATARVITAAALIMICVFLAFVLDDQIFLKMIGLGLAAAVFIDATIVRMVLVPATMELLGDANWWLPSWLDRIAAPPRHRRQPRRGAGVRRTASQSPSSPRSESCGHRRAAQLSRRQTPSPFVINLFQPKESAMYAPTTEPSPQLEAGPRLALRWMPTFLGFPAGGFAAEIVGRVDSPGPAIAGGAIAGAILGFAQWLGMRRTGPSPIAWIIATAVGFAIGLGAGAAAVGYETNLGALATQGADLWRCRRRDPSCGPVPQARTNRAGVASCPRRLVGVGLDHHRPSAGIDVEAQYTNFGASGALVVTACTSVLPIALAHRRQRGAL